MVYACILCLRQQTDLLAIAELTACTSEINSFVGKKTNFKNGDIFISKLEEKNRITKFPEITRVYKISHQHELNGKAENKNRTLLKGIRSVLQQSR